MNLLHQMLEHGRRRLHQTTREFAKFGTIGLINTFVDIGLWNLFNVLAPGSEVKTKIAASLIATAGAFVMNRHWAFRHRKRQQLHRETLLFLLFNAVGLAIQAGSVAVAKYGFDTTDTVMLNAVNIVSLGAAMLFRFWTYRRWVWLLSDPPLPTPAGGVSVDTVTSATGTAACAVLSTRNAPAAAPRSGTRWHTSAAPGSPVELPTQPRPLTKRP